MNDSPIDIATNTNHSENTIGESLIRYNLLSKTTSEGIWDFNLLTGAVYYNETIYSMLGYSNVDMQDNISWWRGNIHPNDRKRVIKEIDDLLLNQNNTWWGEYAFRCKDGTYKNVFERIYVVRDKDLKAVRLIGTMMDLDPLTKLRKQLEADRLAIKNEMTRQAFSASEKERKEISDELHENINQVLAAINLHIDVAKSSTTSGVEWLTNAQQMLVDSIKGIRTLSKQLSPHNLKTFGMHGAIQDLLSDYELETGKPCLYDSGFALNNLLDEEKQLMLYRVILMYLQTIRHHSNFEMIEMQWLHEQDKTTFQFAILDASAATINAAAEIFPRALLLIEAYNGHAHFNSIIADKFVLEIQL